MTRLSKCCEAWDSLRGAGAWEKRGDGGTKAWGHACGVGLGRGEGGGGGRGTSSSERPKRKCAASHAISPFPLRFAIRRLRSTRSSADEPGALRAMDSPTRSSG